MAAPQLPTRKTGTSTWTEFQLQSIGSVDQIIQETENYLTKIFGYPKSFLEILAKASFGRSPSPVVDYDSFIRKTWAFLNTLEDIMNSLEPISSEVTIHTGNPASFNHAATQTEDEDKGSNLVQITAGSEEVQRRIQSFIRKKRQEVDAYNRREFCVFLGDKRETTCARTDAAFVPRHGKKSLLKTYRVYNKIDSSTSSPNNEAAVSWRAKADNVWEPSHPSAKLLLKHIPPETYERIENIEQHLMKRPKIQKKDETAYDVLGKVKELENRILHLEGISPEYINHSLPDTGQDLRHHPYKRQKINQSLKDDKDVESLDKRIMELKQSLLKSNATKIT